MSINIAEQLAKFRNIGDREFDQVIYKTHVPSVAPMAYLTALFKPVSHELLEQRATQLRMPPSLVDFYKNYNGASLFSGTINIFGMLPDHYLLDRAHWFEKRLPFNLLDINRENADHLRTLDLVCVADYGHDRSLVCVRRDTERVHCFLGNDFDRERESWSSLDQWLLAEIQRLSLVFDENGRYLLTDEEERLPSRRSAKPN